MSPAQEAAPWPDIPIMLVILGCRLRQRLLLLAPLAVAALAGRRRLSGQSTQVYTTATTLAADGYFISAFGGNDADGYIIVGMRVKGDTLPRPMSINGVLAPNPDSSIYFTPVLIFGDNSANAGDQAWEQ